MISDVASKAKPKAAMSNSTSQVSLDQQQIVSQLKARVANIEKSYEAIKAKCSIIEEDRQRLEDANKKL